jgi:hypothetical protein
MSTNIPMVGRFTAMSIPINMSIPTIICMPTPTSTKEVQLSMNTSMKPGSTACMSIPILNTTRKLMNISINMLFQHDGVE